MRAAVELGDRNGVEHAGLVVVGNLDVVRAQREVLKLAHLAGVDGVDLRVALVLDGGGGVDALGGAQHRGERHLAGGGRLDGRHGVALAGGDPAAVDEHGETVVRFEGHERLIRGAGLDGAQTQEDFLVREVAALQRDAGPFLVGDFAGGRHRISERDGIGLVGGLDLVIALDDIVVLAQLPRRERGECEVGKDHDEEREQNPLGLEKRLQHSWEVYAFSRIQSSSPGTAASMFLRVVVKSSSVP